MSKFSSVRDPHKTLHQVLCSAQKNYDIGDWSIDSQALGLGSEVSFALSKKKLHGGKQDGVDLITIDNGVLTITVIPTRGMSILKVKSKAVHLGWNSPVKEVVHPKFLNLESRGGLGWLEGFNEWLVRCGLEFAGGPGKDRFTTNTGAAAEMDLTLHGKIGNTPASEVELLVDLEPPFLIRLRGRMDERMLFGPKLELWSEISLTPSVGQFRVEDTITNRGAVDQEFELIYHINFGAPLLEAGSKFAGAVKRVVPMNAHAAQTVDQYASYPGPTPGFVEQVYCIWPKADPQNRTTMMLHNSRQDCGASLEYSVAQLACFTLWKNSNHIDEGYVTGLEPGTNFPHHRSVERQAGRLMKLTAQESRTFALDVGVHSTANEVSRVLHRIAALQGDTEPLIESEPMAIR